MDSVRSDASSVRVGLFLALAADFLPVYHIFVAYLHSMPHLELLHLTL